MAAPLKLSYARKAFTSLPELCLAREVCRRGKSNISRTQRSCITAASTEKNSENTKRFQLVSALVLERRPVITALPTDVEQRYQQLLNKLELEKSMLSDHELRHKADIKLAQRRLQDDFEETEVDANLLTAVDIEDIWNDELKNFKLASRTTESDENNNTKTHKRKLDSCLYFIVKQLFDGVGHWVFPQIVRQEEESMKQAAERLLNTITSDMSVQFLGNAPCAYHKQQYPKKYFTKDYPYNGAKVFFHKALVKSGDITQLLDTSSYADFCWATYTEIQQQVNDRYWNSIKPFLHHY